MPEEHSNSVRLSVIICTYNRADLLRDTLSDLCEQLPNAPFATELIVVDNNCPDHTAQVVREAAARATFPLRYTLEKRQGLSVARNTGIRMAQGDLILFTDDDVRLDKNWAVEMAGAFDDPDVMAAGGKIIPTWPEHVPAWVGPREKPFFPVLFVQYDNGEKALWLGSRDDTPAGANMAFRRCVFDTIGWFREDLGRRGGNLDGGEDAEFFARFLGEYARFRYVPSAVVYHPVPECRLHRRYHLRYLYALGISIGAFEDTCGVVRILGIPRYMIRQMAADAASFTGRMICLDPAGAFRHLGCLVRRIGYIKGVLSRRRLGAT